MAALHRLGSAVESASAPPRTGSTIGARWPTRLKVLVALLKRILSSGPDERILVFVQWSAHVAYMSNILGVRSVPFRSVPFPYRTPVQARDAFPPCHTPVQARDAFHSYIPFTRPSPSRSPSPFVHHYSPLALNPACLHPSAREFLTSSSRREIRSLKSYPPFSRSLPSMVDGQLSVLPLIANTSMR